MRVRNSILSIAAGLTLAASAAAAQEYGSGPPEEVIVTPPWHAPQRSAIGAPIVNVSMSRPVEFGDLDLRTRWGVRTLKSRIGFAATTLCSQLNTTYPVNYDGAGDEWPRGSNCYRDAYERAMVQADAAISRARGEY